MRYFTGMLLTVIALALHSRDESQGLPVLEPSWSVKLAETTSGFPNTSSTFESTRRIAIVGDRVVVVFDVGPIVPAEGRIRSTYRLLSLDRATGEVKAQQQFQGFRVPDIYATNTDQVVTGEFDLTLLNPDLTTTGVEFKESGHGRTIYISPGASVMVHEIHPGSELLDADTLKPLGVHLEEGVPTAVSRRAVVTDNTHWIRDYPKDKAFVTLTTVEGQRLIYHGGCGGRPIFLRDDLVAMTGCGKLIVVPVDSGTSKDVPLPDRNGELAGVSRDGSRFAIRGLKMGGFDPQYVRSEQFTIYDTDHLTPVAMIQSKIAPDGASWSAFSKDGKEFVTGGPKLLGLYRIP